MEQVEIRKYINYGSDEQMVGELVIQLQSQITIFCMYSYCSIGNIWIYSFKNKNNCDLDFDCIDRWSFGIDILLETRLDDHVHTLELRIEQGRSRYAQ
jgi:hypothetical protein